MAVTIPTFLFYEILIFQTENWMNGKCEGWIKSSLPPQFALIRNGIKSVSGRMWTISRAFRKCLSECCKTVPDNIDVHELLPNNSTIKLNFSRGCHIKVNIPEPKKVILAIPTDMRSSQKRRIRWARFIHSASAGNSLRSRLGLRRHRLKTTKLRNYLENVRFRRDSRESACFGINWRLWNSILCGDAQQTLPRW